MANVRESMDKMMLPLFFTWDKDRAVSTLLLSISFSIAFCGLGSLISSGIVVAFYEFLFIIFYLACYRNFPVLAYLKNKQLIVGCLLVFWLIVVLLSYAQLYLVSTPPLHIHMAFARLLATLLHVFFCLSVGCFIVQSRFDASRYFNAVLCSCVLLALLYLLTYWQQTLPSAEAWFVSPPLAVHIRHIGSVVMVAAVIAFTYLFLVHKPLSQLCYLAASVITFSFLCWMGGRTSIVAVLLCLLTLLLYLLSLKRLKVGNVVLVLIAIILAYWVSEWVGVFDWNGAGRIIGSVNHQIVSDDVNSLASVNHQSFTTGRTGIWEVALAAANQSPWLGMGPNGYLSLADRPYGAQPHNMFVQFIVEWGYLGALTFSVLLVFCAFYGLKQLFSSLQETFILSYLLAAIVICVLTLQGMTDGAYFHSQPVFYLCLAFAIFPFNRRSPISQ